MFFKYFLEDKFGIHYGIPPLEKNPESHILFMFTNSHLLSTSLFNQEGTCISLITL